MPTKKKPEDIISAEVEDVLALTKSLEQVEQELMTNQKFRDFLTLQKTVPQRIAEIWNRVEKDMIAHDVKSIKGSWGSITVAERPNFKADLKELPSKFIKKVADTSKISQYYTLEGKLPKGVERTTSKYLMKRIK